MNIFQELKSTYGFYPVETDFVVQEHYATSFHMDLRIKKGNKAPSWAIPKAKFPTNTSERFLAVRTPDHPLEWMRYSGIIPPNQYGAGHVNIYDKGTCIIHSWSDTYIVFKLLGEKIQGYFALIFMKKDQWLLSYLNQEKATEKYEQKEQFFQIQKAQQNKESEDVFYNTKITFNRHCQPYKILEDDNGNTEYYCNIEEDMLEEYIKHNFGVIPKNIIITNQYIEQILVGQDIEEIIQTHYTVSLPEGQLLEGYKWKVVNV